MKGSHVSRRRLSRLLMLSVACGLGLFCLQPGYLGGGEALLSRRQGDALLTHAISSNPSAVFARWLPW